MPLGANEMRGSYDPGVLDGSRLTVYTKLSQSSAPILSFAGMCFVLLFLSFCCFSFCSLFSCFRWSFEDFSSVFFLLFTGLTTTYIFLGISFRCSRLVVTGIGFVEIWIPVGLSSGLSP